MLDARQCPGRRSVRRRCVEEQCGEAQRGTLVPVELGCAQHQPTRYMPRKSPLLAYKWLGMRNSLTASIGERRLATFWLATY